MIYTGGSQEPPGINELQAPQNLQVLPVVLILSQKYWYE